MYGYEPASDSLVYLARAAEFARGEFLNPVTSWNYAPSYSLFLAIPMVFGISLPWALVAIQAAVLGLTYLEVIWRLARGTSQTT